MCWQCDNPDGDYISHLIDLVEEHGWAVSGVEASPTRPGWLHTVGLPARLGHPELLISGCSVDSHHVLNGIADYVRKSGRTIAAGETMRLGDRMYAFGAMTDAHRRDGVIDVSTDVNRVLGVTDIDALPKRP